MWQEHGNKILLFTMFKYPLSNESLCFILSTQLKFSAVFGSLITALSLSSKFWDFLDVPTKQNEEEKKSCTKIKMS